MGRVRQTRLRDNTVGTLNDARVLRSRNNLAEAERMCREALLTSPRDPEWLHLLGLFILDQGRALEALGYLQEAASRMPTGHPFNVDVAAALGGTSALAPFRLPSGAVYQVMIPGKDGKPATMLTLWPAIRRIDAIGSALTVVFTDISTVDIVGEIEVQFRRSNRDYLIVARGGKVIVRA